MRTSELDFDLPEELVARHPADRRDEARMMRVQPGSIEFSDHRFSDLPDLLRPGDLLVLNDTRVIPARLLGRRMPGGGKVEALLLRPGERAAGGSAQGAVGDSDQRAVGDSDQGAIVWWALVKPGKKIRQGDRLIFAPGRLEAVAEAYGEQGSGERLLRLTCPGDWWQTLEEVGHTPLPPYILKARKHDAESRELARTGPQDSRCAASVPSSGQNVRSAAFRRSISPIPPELPEDRERYQTVYAGDVRSAAFRRSIAALPPELPDDRERYQTVYAGEERASVAAPTAGLHFTTQILEALRERGIEHCRVQLHVGAGTFQPIKTDRVEDHPMHEEFFRVPAETAEAVARTRAAGGRVVAVGTTVLRALETAALVAAGDPAAKGVFRAEEDVAQAFQPAQAGQAGKPAPLIPPLVHCASPVVPVSGWTRLFVVPGFRFRACDALLTNFHLPRSSLLLLVEAFAGTETVRAAYAEAVRRRYRFFSYGDCMLIGE